MTTWTCPNRRTVVNFKGAKFSNVSLAKVSIQDANIDGLEGWWIDAADDETGSPTGPICACTIVDRPSATPPRIQAEVVCTGHHIPNVMRLPLNGQSVMATYTMTTILKLRELGLPLPAAAGVLTPAGDLSGEGGAGDTTYTNNGVDSTLSRPQPEEGTGPSALFIGNHDPKDPLISPIYADYTKGFCPSYLLAGTRDFLLSSTVLLHLEL